MSIKFNAKIESYDVQPNACARISSLFRLFQKAACDDCDSTGLTYDVLRNNNIAFVLTKMTLEIYENIEMYDTLVVEAKPRGCRGASFLRDYELKKDGKTLARCCSEWVIINFEKRRILRPSVLDELGGVPVDTTDMFEIKSPDMNFTEENMSYADTRTVYYSQIDRNNHMNNTFYPDIVFDYIPAPYKESLKNLKLTIRYASEISCGDEYDIFTNEENNTFSLVAKNKNTNKIIFTAVAETTAVC
jgi:acyl-ACP thioesterase